MAAKGRDQYFAYGDIEGAGFLRLRFWWLMPAARRPTEARAAALRFGSCDNGFNACYRTAECP